MVIALNGNNEVIFELCKITWNTGEPEPEERTVSCYSEEDKNLVIDMLTEQEIIDYQVVDTPQPTDEIKLKVEGKFFTKIDDAEAVIAGTAPKTEIEILRDAVDMLILASLEE